jgi:hypothetical protein
MDPLLLAGDNTKIIPALDFVESKLYLFELPGGGLAVHRMIGKSGDCAVMKGDRAKRFETVPFRRVIGLVSAVRLQGAATWIPMERYRAFWTVFGRWSRKTAMDRQARKNGGKYFRMRQKGYTLLLVIFSSFLRLCWRAEEKLCLLPRF